LEKDPGVPEFYSEPPPPKPGEATITPIYVDNPIDNELIITRLQRDRARNPPIDYDDPQHIHEDPAADIERMIREQQEIEDLIARERLLDELKKLNEERY
jgi:hypothetical protein